MNQLFLTTIFIILTILCDNGVHSYGLRKRSSGDASKKTSKAEESKSNEDEGSGDISSAGVIVTDNDDSADSKLSAIAIAHGAAAISAGISHNGSIQGHSGDGDHSSEGGSATGTGVLSIATGKGIALATKGNETIIASSTANEDGDTAVGVASSGDGKADVHIQRGTKITSNKISLKNKKEVSASASGKVTSTSISSDEGSVVGTSSTNNSKSSASSSQGIGSASGAISSGDKGKGKKGGSGASGSASGGSAITSISSSDDDYDEHSSSVSAISA